MPRNGSGTYELPSNTASPAVSGTTISSTDFNAVATDIETGLTQSLSKDGQTTPTGNQPMATYRHTGAGDAQALQDYATANQVIDNALTHGGSSAIGADTYAVSLTISPGAYSNKQRFQFLADVSNTGACSININSLGTKSIILADGSAPYDGAIQANSVVDIIYNGTSFILLNPWVDFTELDNLADNLYISGNYLGFSDASFTPLQRHHLHEGSSGGCYTKYTNTTTGATSTDGVLVGLSSTENLDIWQYEANSIRLGTSNATRYQVASDGGLFSNNATGGSQGVDTLNTKGYYLDGVDITSGLTSFTAATINASTSLEVGGVAITSTVAELNILDGVTATAAEINRLDGATGTVKGNLGFYAGRTTASDASTSSLPAGWSVVRNSVGNFTVTHSLSTSNYSVVASVKSGVGFARISTATTTAVTINTYDDAGTLTDFQFHFILSTD